MTTSIETFESTILSRTIEYLVYLPPNYSETNKYPILYAFHGLGVDHTSYSIFTESITSSISSSQIRPFIMIAPKVGNTFYVNKHDGTENWETFFFSEFLPMIESKYPFDNIIKHRSLIGISMGGYGAIYYSLIKENMFGCCVALSPSLIGSKAFPKMIETAQKTGLPWHLGYPPRAMTKVYGNEEYYLKHNVSIIVKNQPIGKYTIPMRICMGPGDYLFDMINEARTIIKEYMPHVNWIETEGKHENSYWLEQFVPALEWIESQW